MSFGRRRKREGEERVGEKQKAERRKEKKDSLTFGVFPDDDDVEPLESGGHPGGVEAVDEVDVEVESCWRFVCDVFFSFCKKKKLRSSETTFGALSLSPNPLSLSPLSSLPLPSPFLSCTLSDWVDVLCSLSGVNSVPLKHTLFLLIDASTSAATSVTGSPRGVEPETPGKRSHSIGAPSSARTSSTACEISGPMPSPGISVMVRGLASPTEGT